MNTNFPRRFSRAASVILLGAVMIFGAAGCAETYTTAPVYRGAYYAYDAYPFGYRGYPGYPYYGAPFGGGASAIVVENSNYGYRRGEDGDRRYRRRNGDHHRRDANRTARATKSRMPADSAAAPER